MPDIEHPQITMARSTGYPTKAHSDWEIAQDEHERYGVENEEEEE